MSEQRFVSEYVEIFDENGSRQAVCVSDNEHTVSFEVKDEYVSMELCDLLNELATKCSQLEKENQRVYGIIEDGGVLLTGKQLLDVIGEDKCDMFFREQETSNKLQEIKADAETALLIIKAMQPLPFKISINEAKSLKRLSENVGELLDNRRGLIYGIKH